MFNRMSIKTKFLLLTAFLAIAMLALYLISKKTINDTSIGSKAYSDIIMSKDLTADILPPPLYIVESYTIMLEMPNLDAAAKLKDSEALIAKKKGEFAERKAYWSENFPEGTIKQTLLTEVCKTAEQLYDIYERDFLPAVLAGAAQAEKAESALKSKIAPKFWEHRAAVEKLADMLEEFSKRTEAGGLEAINSSAVFLIAGFAAVLCVVLACFLLLSRDFTLTFAQCLDFARQAAAGNLDVSIRFKRSDDFGKLGLALDEMIGELRKTLALVREKSEQAQCEVEKSKLAACQAKEAEQKAELAKAQGMLEAAGKLEHVVDVLSQACSELSLRIDSSAQGSDRQSARVSETATAMEQMSSTVLEVARNASEAANTALQAKQKAESGAGIVVEVVRAIAEVQAQAVNLKSDMTNLGKQAEGIGQILSVISDIADQTNLLALNAAIEAARAGEAGRGFAVVADEVRKLAEKTMNATKEVGEAIRGIQNGTRVNVSNVESAVSKIDAATNLANQSGEELGEIVKLVDLTSDQVRSIATASEEQSAASEEINRSIDDISRISAETSQDMSESSGSVSELALQAKELKELIELMKGENSQALPV